MDVEAEIEVLRAETFATQALVTGVLAVMLKNGRKDDVETVFDFAEALHTAASMQEKTPSAKRPSTDVLGVLYRLRDGILLR